MPRDVGDVRREPSKLQTAWGWTEITDHYAVTIRSLDRPPIIMGHSFGGLVTSCSSPAAWAPPAWPSRRRRSRACSDCRSRREKAKDAYDRYQAPEPDRVIFQAAFANFNPPAATKVAFHKDDPPPSRHRKGRAPHGPASVSQEALERLANPRPWSTTRSFPGGRTSRRGCRAGRRSPTTRSSGRLATRAPEPKRRPLRSEQLAEVFDEAADPWVVAVASPPPDGGGARVRRHDQRGDASRSGRA
jgi:hypothetical protein